MARFGKLSSNPNKLDEEEKSVNRYEQRVRETIIGIKAALNDIDVKTVKINGCFSTYDSELRSLKKALALIDQPVAIECLQDKIEVIQKKKEKLRADYNSIIKEREKLYDRIKFIQESICPHIAFDKAPPNETYIHSCSVCGVQFAGTSMLL
jgi:chromosome segregation ATPase